MAEKLVLSMDPEKNLGMLTEFLGRTKGIEEWQVVATYNRLWKKCYEIRSAEGHGIDDTLLYTGLDAIIKTADEFEALDEFKEQFRIDPICNQYGGNN